MIRLSPTLTTVGPLHSSNDEQAGTVKALRRQKLVLAEPERYLSRLDDEARLNAVAHVAVGIWSAIPSEQKQRAGKQVWDEFAHKLTAAAREPTKARFLETLCHAWDIVALGNPALLQALAALTDRELLDTIRHESIYVCLLVRSLRDEAKERAQEGGLFAYALAPVVTSAPREVVRRVAEVPCLSGNSIRGRWRRLAMRDFCTRAGITQIEKRLYHTLFSGGFLDKGSTHENLDRMAAFVHHCPMLGVLGAAVGDGMLEGDLLVGFAYPQCRELGTEADSFWSRLDTVFQTRRDSSKGEDILTIVGGNSEGQPAQQMFYEYEVFTPGTVFDHRVALRSEDELLVSAFWHMLALFQAEPYLGGMGATGNGEVSYGVTIPEGATTRYTEHLATHAAAIREFWANVRL